MGKGACSRPHDHVCHAGRKRVTLGKGARSRPTRSSPPRLARRFRSSAGHLSNSARHVLIVRRPQPLGGRRGWTAEPRRSHGAARGRRGAPGEQARHRRDGAGGRVQARRRTGGALALADRGDAPGTRAVGLDHLPLGGRRLRGDDQHGAEGEGRAQAPQTVGAEACGGTLSPQVARGVLATSRGRVRLGLGDGHRRRLGRGLRAAAHALPPSHDRVERARAVRGEAPLADQPLGDNGTRGPTTRRAEPGSGVRRAGGARPSDPSRCLPTNPTSARAREGGPFRGLPPVELCAKTR